MEAKPRQPQTVEPEQDEPAIEIEWKPYTPSGCVQRVTHTSCCGLYEWSAEGGHFLVLRPTSDGGYEESGRGLYRQALDVYIALAEAHRAEHLRRRERPEPDDFLPRRGRRG